ncbi:MAG TPA: Ldh family oxidoreductase [Isosphaeraceae bacterium]|jgi:LDH2 family malate/lactate/ureidoglycolate dehydrogenase|nr:Ldh family oxidoreductase [Isosphaeraceae bacterium]
MSARVRVAELEDFCRNALARAGACDCHAAIAAEALATTDSWGVFTHGSKLLPGYVRRLRGGGIAGDVEPRVEAEGPAWAILDGGSALGQVVGVRAMDEAIARARRSGIAFVGARRSNHFGAAGYYAARAARAGLVGIAMANDTPSVAAPGSRGPVTGTNPLAYAIPAGAGDPILLDIAMSTVAGGKVYAAHQLGRPIPDDWIVDRQGRPTTDASLYPHHAALAPMAGHKGYGLALLIESLAALATGAAMTTRVGGWMFGDPAAPTEHGAACLALDVAAMAGGAEAFAGRVQTLIDEVHAAPTADGVDRLLLPGEREWANRRRALADGITLPADVVAALAPLADELDWKTDWLPRKP